MKEIDHLMTLETNGLKEYGGELQSKASQLREWLDTPVGSVYGRPSWGCILHQFKHQPMDSIREQVNVECRLLQKLSQDLPNLRITGISYVPRTIDWAQLIIKLPEGTINTEVTP